MTEATLVGYHQYRVTLIERPTACLMLDICFDKPAYLVRSLPMDFTTPPRWFSTYEAAYNAFDVLRRAHLDKEADET